MADVNTFDQGSKILQNVDVSSMVTALALGIAEAQERLDTNSVSQLIRLSESKVAGKSLLELGFQPAFYAFDFADISAKISLKMAVKEEVEVDFSLSVDYKNNQTFDQDFFDELKESKKNSVSKYSKTQKDIALKASTSEDISINEKTTKVHEEEGSYSKIEKSKEQMRDAAQNIRVESVIEDKRVLDQNSLTDVYIAKEGGYVVVTEPYIHTDTEGLLKLDQTYLPAADPSNPVITLKTAKTFEKEVDFATTLANARTENGGTVVGISSTGIHRASGTKVYEFFFDWDKSVIDYSYSTGVKSDSLNEADVTALAMTLKRDPALVITVTGYTDGSGSASQKNAAYNEALGKKRAESFRNKLSKIAGVTFTDARVKIATEGESLANGSTSKDATIRKVTVTFASGAPDYILFNGGEITKTGAAPKNSGPNHFVYVEPTNVTANTGLDITFMYGGETYLLRQGATDNLSSLVNSKGKYEELFIEKVDESYYLLHEETKVNYFVHSSENKELNVKVNNESSEEMNKESTEVYVGETQNELSKLKKSQQDFKGDRSLAISGSLDVRYARQFNMSVEGNASVSARMISVPPPTALENYIQSLTNTNTNSN
ncbi:OmpA family protein [Kordia periserrulae]|uniref:OmpA family protein n=1 Tax=Kordia periserrulae TaxID=701523 RepID=A0A2T6BUL6_9FLAO|nr:OmpA family protein [Kordia periserrulae]PTX59779.1 OmpA family protein [Kordia periserrulae]